MQHCRTFWHIALGAPLQSGSGFGSNGWRRKEKSNALNARWQLLSLCIETWGYYSFFAPL
ncbi:hypothetical protein PHMEG_00036542 [Phytophthora megakarya]|uniref:Uncharacterized protein n=1 Tax=Phytophthora megakarya TaxID=4795 RepID=A0A225ULC4_9STRA|nr:hypothetical protein PHMEG_00036542 [Phytophthora megakarya]